MEDEYDILLRSDNDDITADIVEANSAFDDSFVSDETTANSVISDHLANKNPIYLQNATFGRTQTAKSMHLVIPQISNMVNIPSEREDILTRIFYDSFTSETILEENNTLTSPELTTCTMQGFLENTTFEERLLIQKLTANNKILVIKCNYGKIVYTGYVEPKPIKTNNRGRKKKIKPPSNRKKQGNGEEFNNQITFEMRSGLYPINPDGTVDSDAKLYKFKVFHTGTLQFPGGHKDNTRLDDILDCVKILVETLNEQLHPQDNDASKLTELTYIKPVMKNYKFRVKVPEHHIVKLSELKQILLDEQSTTLSVLSCPEHPPICTVDYDRQHSKLATKFFTPIKSDMQKCLHVNIFMTGKINILGASHSSYTKQITKYINWIFDTYKQKIIVMEGRPKRTRTAPTPIDNVLPMSDDEIRNSANRYISKMHLVPKYINNDHCRAILSYVSRLYKMRVKNTNVYLKQMLIEFRTARKY